MIATPLMEGYKRGLSKWFGGWKKKERDEIRRKELKRTRGKLGERRGRG